MTPTESCDYHSTSFYKQEAPTELARCLDHTFELVAWCGSLKWYAAQVMEGIKDADEGNVISTEELLKRIDSCAK